MTITQAFTDPSVTGPNLLFNTGQVSGITQLYNPVQSNAPGGHDDTWSITQWATPSFFSPNILSPNIVNPAFGTSIANWTTPDGLNGVAVFGTPGNYVYQLTNNGGNTKDVLLNTVANAPLSYTFDKQVTFSAQEGISAIVGSSSGEGPATGGNNFTVAFNRQGSPGYDPSLPTLSEFLQFGLFDQRGLPPILDGDDMYNIAPSTNNDNEALYYTPDDKLHQVTINLSAAVAQLAESLYKNSNSSGIPGVGSALLDLSKWSLTTCYIGSETTDTGVTMDVAHPVVQRDDTINVSQATAAATTKVVSVVGGLNQQWQLDTGNGYSSQGLNNPAMQVAIQTYFNPTQIAAGANGNVYNVVNMIDPSESSVLYATLTLSDPSLGHFDISALSAIPGFGDTATVSADGKTLTLEGDGLSSDLSALKFDANAGLVGTANETFTLSVSNPYGASVEQTQLQVIGSQAAPPPVDLGYVFQNGYYALNQTSGTTANISGNLASNTAIFGSNENLNFSGGNAVIVYNAPNLTGNISVQSTTGNVVWAGTGTVNYQSGGNSTIVLCSTPSANPTLTLGGGSNTDQNIIDVWGSTGQTATITNTSAAQTTVFGGGAGFDYTGGSTVLVLNGTASGNASVTSTGHCTVWAGSSMLNFQASQTADTLILTGNSTTVVHGSSNAAASVQVLSLGDTGNMQYFGNNESSVISLTHGNSTIMASSGNTSITAGSGNMQLTLNSVGHATIAMDGHQAGNADIFNFSASQDTLHLTSGSVVTTGVQNGSLVLGLQDGHSITLHGVTSSSGILFG